MRTSLKINCVFIILFILLSLKGFAQKCTALGQNPETAFPVCGTSVFRQAEVPACGNREMPSGCSSPLFTYADKNPYWYSFTCYRSGSLGFTITPNKLSDDYDWQLFDVTNESPQAVYTRASLFVACNWSGVSGITGASAAGNSLIVCEGQGRPLFTSMPVLIKDHDYLLMVSHFTNSQSGYSLAFPAGTASITDTTKLRVKGTTVSCDAKKISLKLNRKIQCNSISKYGTEFSLSPAIAISNVEGIGCFNNFGTDSIVLSFSSPVPQGNYTLSITKGDDGNMLLDICGDEILPENIELAVKPGNAATIIKGEKEDCSPAELIITLDKPVLCNSIAANGSDFSISGTGSTINITAAEGFCNNTAFASRIRIKFSGPVNQEGKYILSVKKGTDGNTLIDECGLQVAANTAIGFTTDEMVTAAFDFILKTGCVQDTIYLQPKTSSTNFQWLWEANGERYATNNPSVIYTLPGEKKIKLTVSNGVCADSNTVNILLSQKIKAAFEAPAAACSNQTLDIFNNSTGNITSWTWDWGNGLKDFTRLPVNPAYRNIHEDAAYNITLVIRDGNDCADTVIKPIRIMSNCNIAIPSAFSPNNDGINDYLYPVNAGTLKDFRFSIYNRLGQLIFESANASQKWDGTFRGQKQRAGSYIWILDYKNTSGRKTVLKGSTLLIR
ncbi:MAG: gliding motility-associated C-terminal domain-containing protein [Ferruginibacter sp.]